MHARNKKYKANGKSNFLIKLKSYKLITQREVHGKKKQISRRSVREQPFFISTRPNSLNAARQRDPCSRRQASTVHVMEIQIYSHCHLRGTVH